MLTLLGLVGLLLPTVALGSSSRRDMQLHEYRTEPSSGYIAIGPAPPETVLTLRLALVQNNLTNLVDTLYDVSTPSSPNYGAYLSKEEISAYLSPTNETVSVVNSWLSENGLGATGFSATGGWLSVQMPVSAANDLFSANYSVFTHSATGKQTVRTLAYSIPADLADHLDFVHPTISFPHPGSGTSITDSSSYVTIDAGSTGPCNVSLITPACLQWLYDIPTTPAKSDGNALAVPGYSNEWPQIAYLTTFLEKYRPDVNPDRTWELVTLDEGSDPQGSNSTSIEGNLDVQYTIGLATNVTVKFISVSNVSVPPEDEFASYLLDTATYMLDLDSPPPVMSTSYGCDEERVSQKLAKKLCSSYAALGARGVSVLFGSGDGGVSGIHYPDETCTTFIPTFPGGCPYLTSVGGTNLVPEIAADFSGGGFSNYWTRPPYQESAVAQYLDYLGDTNAGLYNSSGRAFPDVAAYSVNFDVIYGGAEGPINGTSCAGPTFASIISLLNDELIAAGRPVLGFLNPWLYSNASATLTDITIGNNFACSNFTTGFNATVGWDAVTGLGTPNYKKLKAVLGL
ncbi:family S53 protease [Fomitopsis betulina]|nr:family S53 protease [Fomitopsis betulina]